MPFVRVRDVSHRFGRRLALENVSFSLPRGGFAFITGPSGAGKTTLLRLMHGDLPLQHGHMVVAGHSLTSLPKPLLPELRREVGLIFQDYKILPERSVAENVALSLEVRGLSRARVTGRVAEVIQSLGLAGLAYERCGELSGGEQQRVAIARALAMSPKLILADEPTGNLDDESAANLMELFRQANDHGTAFIVATHDARLPDAIPGAAVFHMDHGNLSVPDTDEDEDER